MLSTGFQSFPFPHPTGKPKICLLGDSIRMGYAPFVEEILKEKALFFSPTENGGDSINLLKYLHLWVQAQKPEIVHLNCGLHDLKTLAYGAGPKDNLVPIHQYKENVGRILNFISKYQPEAKVVWATITPIDEIKAHESHSKWKDFDRYEESVLAYNEAAKAICRETKTEVNDLFAFCKANKIQGSQEPDGVHFTSEGSRKLGEEVARVLATHL